MSLQSIIITPLSLLTILGNIFLVFFLIDLFYEKLTSRSMFPGVRSWFRSRAVISVFVVSFIASGGSLLLSDVLMFAPCKLCWFQRIFMYPLVFLSGLGVLRREKKILPYIFILAILGALIAGFHYTGQLTDTSELLPCDTLGQSPSCSEHYIKMFGYVTIPFMSLTAFLLIISSYILFKKS